MTIPGNPYALIKNGICTAVIAMQDYDLDTINKTLESQDYDEIVICSEVGYEIYLGYRYYDDVDLWASLPIHETWVLNKITRRWEPPIPYPNDGAEYYWSEEDQNWITCTSNESNSEETLIKFIDIIDINGDIDLISSSTKNSQASTMEDTNAN